MRIRASILLSTIAALALPLSAFPQSFEGIVKQRTIEVGEYGLSELLYDDEGEEPDFETEVEWLRYSANKLFSLPTDRLLSSGEGADWQEITLYVKGSKVRYDQAGEDGGGYMIMDAESQTTWMVIPSERSFIKWTAEEAQAAAEDAAREAEEMMVRMGLDPEELRAQAEAMGETDEEDGGVGGAPTVRSLGRTEDINGFRASAYEAASGEEIALGWCAEDASGLLGTMEMLAKQAGMNEEEDVPGSGPDTQELVCRDKLPVKVQVYSPSRMNAYVMEEIVSIQATSVSDARFQIPDGYTEKKLSDMWK